MKCKHCDGVGFFDNGASQFKCVYCDGTGEVEMTNEEWFCSLPTEEKAKTIVCLEVNALHKWKKGLVESDVDEIKRWLKEKHK